MTYGEQLLIDVIAMDTTRTKLFLYRSDLPYARDLGGDQYVFPIPRNNTPQDMRKDGFVSTVSIRADVPTESIDQIYRAFIDERNYPLTFRIVYAIV
ncbi:MAG: hypothetical protein NTZ04_00585 [Chloroflexi bacterium]|nr:hypothetical protein [Chloroflexota bacterium]